MDVLYPGVYKAQALGTEGAGVRAHIPQLFGDTVVTVSRGNLPSPPTGVGWVAFEGGQADHPVWLISEE